MANQTNLVLPTVGLPRAPLVTPQGSIQAGMSAPAAPVQAQNPRMVQARNILGAFGMPGAFSPQAIAQANAQAALTKAATTSTPTQLTQQNAGGGFVESPTAPTVPIYRSLDSAGNVSYSDQGPLTAPAHTAVPAAPTTPAVSTAGMTPQQIYQQKINAAAAPAVAANPNPGLFDALGTGLKEAWDRGLQGPIDSAMGHVANWTGATGFGASALRDAQEAQRQGDIYKQELHAQQGLPSYIGAGIGTVGSNVLPVAGALAGAALAPETAGASLSLAAPLLGGAAGGIAKEASSQLNNGESTPEMLLGGALKGASWAVPASIGEGLIARGLGETASKGLLARLAGYSAAGAAGGVANTAGSNITEAMPGSNLLDAANHNLGSSALAGGLLGGVLGGTGDLVAGRLAKYFGREGEVPKVEGETSNATAPAAPAAPTVSTETTPPSIEELVAANNRANKLDTAQQAINDLEGKSNLNQGGSGTSPAEAKLKQALAQQRARQITAFQEAPTGTQTTLEGGLERPSAVAPQSTEPNDGLSFTDFMQTPNQRTIADVLGTQGRLDGGAADLLNGEKAATAPTPVASPANPNQHSLFDVLHGTQTDMFGTPVASTLPDVAPNAVANAPELAGSLAPTQQSSLFTAGGAPSIDAALGNYADKPAASQYLSWLKNSGVTGLPAEDLQAVEKAANSQTTKGFLQRLKSKASGMTEGGRSTLAHYEQSLKEPTGPK